LRKKLQKGNISRYNFLDKRFSIHISRLATPATQRIHAMQNHSSHTNPGEAAAARKPLFAAPPPFLCALPANLAQLRPLFMAEPDEHGDPCHEEQ
jgi:hypothetical protein